MNASSFSQSAPGAKICLCVMKPDYLNKVAAELEHHEHLAHVDHHEKALKDPLAAKEKEHLQHLEHEAHKHDLHKKEAGKEILLSGPEVKLVDFTTSDCHRIQNQCLSMIGLLGKSQYMRTCGFCHDPCALKFVPANMYELQRLAAQHPHLVGHHHHHHPSHMAHSPFGQPSYYNQQVSRVRPGYGLGMQLPGYSSRGSLYSGVGGLGGFATSRGVAAGKSSFSSFGGSKGLGGLPTSAAAARRLSYRSRGLGNQDLFCFQICAMAEIRYGL